MTMDEPDPHPEPGAARLILPDPAFTEGYLAALGEGFCDSSESPAPDAARLAAIAADPAPHIASLNAQGGAMYLADGRRIAKVRFAHFWLVSGPHFIGRTGVRYGLNEGLRLWGGHIGYEIRPGLRRRGFGHLALTLAIAHMQENGIGRLLLTCRDDNVASARIIEAHGGVLEALAPHPLYQRVMTRRYWIEA